MEDTFQIQARRFVEQVNREMYELGNLDVVDAVYGDGYMVHDSAGSGEGVWRTSEEIKKGVLDMRLAFPDMRIEVGELMAYRDGGVTMLSYQFTLTGTHSGPYGKLPATYRKIRVSGMWMGKLVDGRLVEGWNGLDRLGLAQQLGLLDGQRAATSSRSSGWFSGSRRSASGSRRSSSGLRQRDGWSDLTVAAALALGFMIGDE